MTTISPYRPEPAAPPAPPNVSKPRAQALCCMIIGLAIMLFSIGFHTGFGLALFAGLLFLLCGWSYAREYGYAQRRHDEWYERFGREAFTCCPGTHRAHEVHSALEALACDAPEYLRRIAIEADEIRRMRAQSAAAIDQLAKKLAEMREQELHLEERETLVEQRVHAYLRAQQERWRP